MTQRNRKIHELDGKAAALLAAGRLSDEEIERIASAPHTLASIRERIKSERSATNVEPRIVHSKPFIFGLRPAFAALAVLVVAAVGLGAFLRLRNESQNIASVPALKLDNSTPTASIPSDFYPDTVAPGPMPKVARSSVQQASYKPEPHTKRVVNSAKQQPEEPPLEFYTLPTVQDAAEVARDARIVTVELPRASLIALGANIPLEGNRQIVKADLLVGPDGVPRAIRLAD